MQIGYIGLGKMGHNMVLHLLEKKYDVVVTDTSHDAVLGVAEEGARGAANIRDLVAKLSTPRLVWMMVPQAAVDEVLGEMVPLLDEGDTVVDGGNSNYKHSVRRAGELRERGVGYLDVGVSGGTAAARSGACFMIGGDRALFEKYEHLFRDLAVADGYGYLGKSGAGHFVKMVHNGIEYGMMQAIAEGVAVMKASPFDVDLKRVAKVYNHGSIIESRLVGWLAEALERFGVELDGVTGSVAHTGEGEWTVEAARELGVDVPIIKGAFDFRVASANTPSYTGKVVSALRNMFGGHSIKKD